MVDLTIPDLEARLTSVEKALRQAEIRATVGQLNFSPPIANRTIYTASGATIGTAGNITSTVTTNRQIQFGLKLLF